MINEPMHDTNARDTSISKSEGRLKVSITAKKRHLKRMVKGCRDGAGGPGVISSNLSGKDMARLASLGIKGATGKSSLPGGVAPGAKKKTKKVSFSGAKSTLSALLKKKAVKKMVAAKMKYPKFKNLSKFKVPKLKVSKFKIPMK